MANDEHVAKLREGVVAWNDWRDENPDVVVDLRGAKLEGADLQYADLAGADLWVANLEGAELLGAYLERANLEKANLEGAELQDADLAGANLTRANLKGASLRAAKLERAWLLEANLSDADLRTASNIRLDSTFVRNTQFSARASDPWSVLRRGYTGPRMTFNLLLLVAFALPFVGKVGFWSFVNQVQVGTRGVLEKIRERALEQGIDDQTIAAIGLSPDAITPLSQCFSEACEEHTVWQLLLGVDQGGMLWLLPATLVLYNILRGVLTFFVAPMRDEEERSGYSPVFAGEEWWHVSDRPNGATWRSA